MFTNSTCLTIFTMFRNVSQNILRKCFVIYCTVHTDITKMAALQNSWLLQLCSLSAFLLLQRSLAPIEGNPNR